MGEERLRFVADAASVCFQVCWFDAGRADKEHTVCDWGQRVYSTRDAEPATEVVRLGQVQ